MDLLKHILVIEDHTSLRTLLNHLLSKRYAVTTKPNGLEAMAWIAQGNTPDLILLDINMPLLNGMELVSNIKCSGVYADIPIIVISGSVNEEGEQQLIDLGVEHFLYKPFKPEELFESITKCFHKSIA